VEPGLPDRPGELALPDMPLEPRPDEPDEPGAVEVEDDGLKLLSGMVTPWKKE